jgi:hypothetical protein
MSGLDVEALAQAVTAAYACGWAAALPDGGVQVHFMSSSEQLMLTVTRRWRGASAAGACGQRPVLRFCGAGWHAGC